MKKLLLTFLAGLLISGASAQTMINPFLQPEVEPATAFIGFSTGIDNMVGILGPQLDIVVVKNLMLGGGVGLSSWGYKYAANVQFYPKSLYRFYFKTGYSQNSGLVDFETELELMSGEKEQVRMDLKPVGNIFFTAGRAWKIGKRNRIYLEVGYAFPLVTDDYYTLYDDNIELSKTSEQVLQMMRPGGLVIAAGLNFAISNFYKVN
jgi:hypothetical protein